MGNRPNKPAVYALVCLRSAQGCHQSYDTWKKTTVSGQHYISKMAAWYAHPEKIAQLKDNHVPSVTEICGLLGFAPASWTAVNAMRDYMAEFLEEGMTFAEVTGLIDEDAQFLLFHIQT